MRLKTWIVRNNCQQIELWSGEKIPEIIEDGWWGDNLVDILPHDNPLGAGLTTNSKPKEVMLEITVKENQPRQVNKVNELVAKISKLRNELNLLKIKRSCFRCLEQFDQGLCDSCAEEMEEKLNRYWEWDDRKKVYIKQTPKQLTIWDFQENADDK